jgi:hypothetical protein
MMPRRPDLSKRRSVYDWRQLAEARVRQLKFRTYEPAVVAEAALQLASVAAALLRDVGDGKRLAELADTVETLRQ